MQREFAKFMESAGIGSVHEDYSGRGMMGRTTTALEVESINEFATGLYELAEDIAENKEDDTFPEGANFRFDSLGLKTIVY